MKLYIGWRISPNPLVEARENANRVPDRPITLETAPLILMHSPAFAVDFERRDTRR
jgi:hypothetical protein